MIDAAERAASAICDDGRTDESVTSACREYIATDPPYNNFTQTVRAILAWSRTESVDRILSNSKTGFAPQDYINNYLDEMR